MQQYNLTLLSGGGRPLGVNDLGQIAGFLVQEDGPPVGVWWLPAANAGEYQSMVQPGAMDPARDVPRLTAINNIGLVIPGNELICINWGDANFSHLPANVLAAATAINNSGQIVSGSNIYTAWPQLTPPPPTPIPLADCIGYAINDLGDVVGTFLSGGFFFSGGKFSGTGPGSLLDINGNRMAVGYLTLSSGINSPAWIQYPPGAQGWGTILPMTKIPLPSGSGSGRATAINNVGTIVGFAFNESAIQFAFVAGQPGSPAVDLNGIVGDTQGWYLHDAMDINEHGMIVGTCVRKNPDTGGDDIGGYIATPLNPYTNPLRGGSLAGLLGAVANGISGMSGMEPLPKGLGHAWEALTPEQRDTLIGFAIWSLAGLMGEGEIREQILHLATEAAFPVPGRKGGR